MSIVFSIKNKKSLFGYQKVLAAQEVLKLVEGLTTYNYDPATLHRPLNDFEGLNCIVFGKSGLPLQLRYFDEEESYQIQVPSFAKEFEVQGFAHPVYLDRDTVQEVLNHVHPLEAYSAFIKKIQYSAAYFSQVRFYQQEETGAFLASYSLTEDTDTVLPSVPHVPAEYVEIVGLAGIIDWRVLLVAIDGDPDKPENYHPIGSLALKNLLEALEPDEFQQLDASQIEIKKLSKERLLELAQLENK